MQKKQPPPWGKVNNQSENLSHIFAKSAMNRLWSADPGSWIPDAG